MSVDSTKQNLSPEHFGIMPQVEAVMVKNKDKKLYIGLPKERTFNENRIGLTPDAVRVLVANGHRVTVEHDAGKLCGFSDYLYSEAGAQVTKNIEEVFQANIIIKVAPPTLFEIELMQANQYLISPIHIPTITKEYLYGLMKKKINAIAYEFYQDDANNYPFVTAMSEIAGANAILIAAELLSNVNNGKGLFLGGISGVPPAKIVLLGSGTVGTFAARAALGLGAQISVFDNDLHKLSQLQNNIGQRVFTSVITPEVLKKEILGADVVIGAIHSSTGRTPEIVSEDIVEQMKKGSVIIDVSIDQGGCFATSKVTTLENPTYIEHDVIHYCVPNIPARVAQTASFAFSHLITPILFKADNLGGISNLIRFDRGACKGIYTYNGHLTHSHLAQKFDIKYTNLNLIFGAGF